MEEKTKWDPESARLLGFVRKQKTQIPIKEASEIGTKKVSYFRGKDFVKHMVNNKELERKLPSVLTEFKGSCPASEKEAERLGQRLLDHGLVYRANRRSRVGTEARPKRYPDRLSRAQKQFFDREGFFVIRHPEKNSWTNVALGAFITFVISVCLFPIWPIWAKIVVWYFSVALICFILFLTVARLFLFAVSWPYGVDFWLVPNLWDEGLGVIDSFFPFHTLERRKDGLQMLFVRLAFLFLICASVSELGKTHSLLDFTVMVHDGVQDVIEWGNHTFIQPQLLEGSTIEGLTHEIMDDDTSSTVSEDVPEKTEIEL